MQNFEIGDYAAVKFLYAVGILTSVFVVERVDKGWIYGREVARGLRNDGWPSHRLRRLSPLEVIAFMERIECSSYSTESQSEPSLRER